MVPVDLQLEVLKHYQSGQSIATATMRYIAAMWAAIASVARQQGYMSDYEKFSEASQGAARQSGWEHPCPGE